MVFFFTHPVELVQLERSLYKKMTDKAKSSCKEHGLTDLQASTPCSCSISMHYSFDYAQQVHLPSDPLQPGPIYFLVPRKLGLFGFCCEIFAKYSWGIWKFTSLGRWTFWLMKLISSVRGRMLSCPTCIISFSIMDSVRLMLTSNVRARTRTDSYSDSVHRELPSVFTDLWRLIF